MMMNTQTIASFGNPRRLVAALGSTKSNSTNHLS